MSRKDPSSSVQMPLVKWSPDGQYVASTAKEKVKIEFWNSKGTIKRKTCQDVINALEWSGDSSYVALGMFRIGSVRILSIDHPDWRCKISTNQLSQNSLGLIDLSWGPDCRQLITVSSLYAEIIVWSISSAETFKVPNVLPVVHCKSFSPNGKMVAVLRFSENLSTNVSLFSSSNWELLNEFFIISKDAAAVSWCPDGNFMMVQDSSLFSGLYIYSPTGQLVKQFCPDGLSPGFVNVVWSPIGQFLATASHRNIIRLLNSVSFGTTIEDKVDPNLLQLYPGCKKYNEISTKITDGYFVSSIEEEKDAIVIFLSHDTDAIKQSILKFNDDGLYFAFWTDFYPSAAWIWDVRKGQLGAVVTLLYKITDLSWKPNSNTLALCTNRAMIYYWEPSGARVETNKTLLDNGFNVTSILWNPVFPVRTMISNDTGNLLLPCD